MLASVVASSCRRQSRGQRAEHRRPCVLTGSMSTPWSTTLPWWVRRKVAWGWRYPLCGGCGRRRWRRVPPRSGRRPEAEDGLAGEPQQHLRYHLVRERPAVGGDSGLLPSSGVASRGRHGRGSLPLAAAMHRVQPINWSAAKSNQHTGTEISVLYMTDLATRGEDDEIWYLTTQGTSGLRGIASIVPAKTRFFCGWEEEETRIGRAHV